MSQRTTWQFCGNMSFITKMCSKFVHLQINCEETILAAVHPNWLAVTLAFSGSLNAPSNVPGKVTWSIHPTPVPSSSRHSVMQWQLRFEIGLDPPGQPTTTETAVWLTTYIRWEINFIICDSEKMQLRLHCEKCKHWVEHKCVTESTELCKIIPAKLGEFLPIFPKMADGQEEAGLSSLAALRRENSNMQESFYTSL